MKLTNRTWQAWIDAVGAGWSSRAAADLDELRSLVRAASAPEDLRALGAHLGSRRYALGDVLRWLDLLAASSRRAGRLVRRPGAVGAVSSGWADGAMDAAVGSGARNGLNIVESGNSRDRMSHRHTPNLHSLAS